MPIHSILLAFHVLGACIWFGGYVVLSFVILPKAKADKTPRLVVDFERRFRKIGWPALAVQMVTGPIMALRFVPDPGDWFLWQTANQDHIASKLIMLVILVALATVMQARVIPRLQAEESGSLKSAAKVIHSMTFFSFMMVFTGLDIHTLGFAY
ncbi:MAG: hypothetical protein COA70_10590 [Planctomycetota bacterium]|nr:MAG: hypothetical protein COA70_10590 [Planctomycetota bacterium]